MRPAAELDPERVASPDGKLVAFARGSKSEPPSLWVADPDGKNARQVLSVDRAKVVMPPPGRWRSTSPRPLSESSGLIVGPEPANLARFLAKRCGLGAAPPDPPKPKLPAALGKGRRVCGSSLYTKKTIPFLDGTALDLVFTRDLGEPGSLPMAMDLETAESVLESQCAPPAE